MSSDIFTDINAIFLGFIIAIIFVLIIIQIKNRKALKYLHYLKNKLFSRKNK
ncbi:MAG: hypothetical protein KJ963_04380 [Bacteroidetes bacterium]|nr:hypothetical protein [Bacteroidota bacterium]